MLERNDEDPDIIWMVIILFMFGMWLFGPVLVTWFA